MARRLKALLWPEKGLRRAGRYVALRLSRLRSSPHSVAAGFASGAAVSMTPLLGLHFLLGFGLAFLTRGSLVAAALGTAVGNPLTFPMIFAATYWIGDRLRNLGATDPEEVLETVAEGFDPVEEAEAEDAAEAVLETAQELVESGWGLAEIGAVWPLLSTMLLGSALAVPVAYACAYALVRIFMRGLAAKRGRRAVWAGRLARQDGRRA